jgi:hypothetical protein
MIFRYPGGFVVEIIPVQLLLILLKLFISPGLLIDETSNHPGVVDGEISTVKTSSLKWEDD